MTRALVTRSQARTLARLSIPKYRLARTAVRYAPNVARAAARTIGMAYRAYKKRRMNRPSRRQVRKFRRRPDLAGRTGTQSTVTMTQDTLYTNNLTTDIDLGTGSGDRTRRYADLIGIRLAMYLKNNSVTSGDNPCVHVIVAQLRGSNVGLSANENFFTAMGDNIGYQGAAFNNLAFTRQDKNLLPIYSPKWRVFLHKKVILGEETGESQRPVSMYRGGSTVYRKYWIPIKQRIYFDPDEFNNEAQRPIYLLTYHEPLDPNGTTHTVDMRLLQRVYFKKSN